MFGRFFENLRSFVYLIPTFVARLYHNLERDTVGFGALRDTVRLADRFATELQDRVFAEKLMHLARVNTARRDRHDAGKRSPMLIEEHTVQGIRRNEILAQDVVETVRRVRIAFELTDDGAGVDVVDAE